MPVVDPQVVDIAFRNMETRFWHKVTQTLDQVFAASGEQRAEFQRRLARYREQMADAPPGEQLLVYHSEPLDVAADLAGVDVTDKHVAIYLD